MIVKYPRTRHIEGSGLQDGDEDLELLPFSRLVGQHLVVEEKMDGANCAVSFHEGGLRLQSRGHFLTGGPRERQFELFKSWANRHAGDFHEILGERYVMYGEWLYAKHTVFYTDLPHYFLEFDVWDREQEVFLGTAERGRLLELLPVVSVRVLHAGSLPNLEALLALVGPSPFIDVEAPQILTALAREKGLAPENVLRETDLSGLMEGLYLKQEANGVVEGRYKWVRGGFQQTMLDSGSHWQERPILPNRLRPGVDLFGP